MEKVDATGSTPQARFGHTITYIPKGKAILFGGATGDTGKYSITGETFSFDIATRVWKKVETTGQAPSARAAHAAVAVESNQIVIYGGATGGGSLASDDLVLLDLRNEENKGNWTVVPVVGPTPGRRYGHTLTYTKPFLVVFGGNTGQEPVNDYWCFNVEKSPFSWQKIESEKDEIPCARVYHSASLCTTGSASGMVVIFGGRSADQVALNDTFGLRRHRDGRWDWIRAPSKNQQQMPTGRYQHSSIFVGSLLLTLGGRTNNVGETLGMELYDTETSEYHKVNSVQRFRHGSWLVENYLYIYGGFELDSPNIPTDTIQRVNLYAALEKEDKLLQKTTNFIQGQQPQYEQQQAYTPTLDQQRGNYNNINQQQQQQQNFNNNNNQQQMFAPQQQQQQINNQNFNNGGEFNQQTYQNKQGGPTMNIIQNNKNQNNSSKPFKIMKAQKIGTKANLTDQNALHNIFLNQLLQPKYYINLPENAMFSFRPEHIIPLCDAAEDVLRSQPMVLRVRAPIKIFGDIHGQYCDLMRFFDLWGSPYENGKDGDIESFDYLFLGDFVDRGCHSLETICLLLALKIRYPEQVHLIRGNHEDKWINNGFGFSEECATRLGEDPNDEDSCFQRVNRLFEWLPLATIIEDKIICLHGGIGSSLHCVQEIEQLQRPLEVIHEVLTPEQQLVVDILWSDPTDSDMDLGIQPNIIRDPAGTGNIVKFGPDRVLEFLNKNNLSMIIRAHECVMDGFERFAGGSLITVFSATDYCGRHKNAGAVLLVKKTFEIVPKLIYPSNVGQHHWIEDEETLKKRPPTPPRWKNNMPRKSYE